jgi:hypothetical protein
MAMTELPAYVNDKGTIRCRPCILKIADRVSRPLKELVDYSVEEDWTAAYCVCDKCKRTFAPEERPEPDYREDTPSLDAPWWEYR